MTFRLFGVEVSLSFWFFAMLLAFLLINGEVLSICLLLPILIHELGHLIAMISLRVGIQSLSLTPRGIAIRRKRSPVLPLRAEVLISASGAAANLLTAIAARALCFPSMRMRLFIAANIAVAAFNLLPIGDLDGGQLLELMSARFLAPAAARVVEKAASLLVLSALFGLAIFLLLSGIPNPTLLVVCVFLAYQVIAGS